MLFDSLLLHLAYREDHVGGAAVWTESTLVFRQVFLRDVGDEAIEDDPSQDLPSDRQERDAPVVAVVSLTAPVLEQMNVAFLNSLGTASSSQMLVRSEWSASRATGPADLKISAGIPSIRGDVEQGTEVFPPPCVDAALLLKKAEPSTDRSGVVEHL